MERFRHVAALAAILAPLAGPARAQFQPVAMRLPAWERTELGAGVMGGAGPGSDLLLVRWGGSTETVLYHYRDLLTPRAAPYALPAPPADSPAIHATVGSFGGTAAPDVIWESLDGTLVGLLDVSWGAAPAVCENFYDVPTYATHGLQPLQLLPAPEPPLLVHGYGEPGTQDDFCAHDLSAARGTGAIPAPQCWVGATSFDSAYDAEPWEDRFHAVRVSPAATSGRGVVDAIVPLMQGFRLLWNTTPQSATGVADVALNYVTVGWPSILADIPPALLEPGLTMARGAQCFGGGGLDVDGDGDPDVLFTMREPGVPGKLLYVENTGTPAQFPTAVWHGLMGRGDLQPIQDPAVLRQLDLPGAPVLALHDVALDEILLLSGSGAGGIAVRRLPAFGATVRDFRVADVVGGEAPDLLAWVAAPGGTFEVWVYPDELDAAPTLAWSPEPTVALLGADLTLSVDAADADSPFTLTWIRPPAPDAIGTATLTIPGSELCATTPVDVTVRALDDLGVYVQLHASIPVELRPSLVLVGAEPAGRIVFAPGGASGRAEGEAWPACGSAPAFTWGSPGLSGLVETARGESGSAAWREFTIPESAYPEALSSTTAGEPALTLSAAEGALSGTAALPLDIDARGLVRVQVSFDQPVLTAGELGTIRIGLENQLSVPLPAVRALVRLDGLEFAGDVTVTGAPATAGPGEGEVVVDPLPAAPATVELVVPVRSAGGPGGASVELFSPSGIRVSPEAAPPASDALVPGCGCGTGGAGSALPILLALWASCRRRAGSSPGRAHDERAAQA